MQNTSERAGETHHIFMIEDPRITELIVRATMVRNPSMDFQVKVSRILSCIPFLDYKDKEGLIREGSKDRLNIKFPHFCTTIADSLYENSKSEYVIARNGTLTEEFTRCMAIRVHLLPEDFEKFGKYMFDNLSKIIANTDGMVAWERYCLTMNDNNEIVLIPDNKNPKPLLGKDPNFTKARII